MCEIVKFKKNPNKCVNCGGFGCCCKYGVTDEGYRLDEFIHPDGYDNEIV